LADAYGYVFLTAAACIAISLFNIIRMEERPLRSGIAPDSSGD
jgi:hypothetical protein